MGLKIFGAGGIDQKSNDLLRDPRDLRDSKNVMININNEYCKRPGTDEDPDLSPDTFNDVTFIKSLGEYFFRSGDDYIRYKDGVRSVIPRVAIDPTTSPESNISGAEYLNTFIFTHQEGQSGTFKYDGYKIYMAGLPVPQFTTTNAGGGSKIGFMISFYDFIDAQGNQIFGPSKITPTTDELQNITLTVPTPQGFYSGSIFVKNTGGPKALSATSLLTRTMPYDSISSDIVVGRRVAFRPNGSSGNVSISIFDASLQRADLAAMIVEIESIDTTLKKIVFKESSFNGLNMLYDVGATAKNILGSLVFRVFYSDSETTGYEQDVFYNNMIVDTTKITEVYLSVDGVPVSSFPKILLSDIYDITTSKLRPPISKYITTYGYQIVSINVSAFWNFQNVKSNYTNNDLVMYSDTSTGDLGENFSEGNRQLIGDTFDGEITGAVRVKDSLVIFKNRSPYILDGVLIPGQFSLRKVESNEIGCVSDKSILSLDGGVIFQGQDGLYAIDGYICKKVSTPIDPFFKTIDPSLTRSVMNNVYNQYIFWTDNGLAVFDYDFGKWFIWDSIDASKGITVDNNQEIKFFSSTKSVQFIEAKNDSGVAIDAWIKTTWHDLKEPSLLKKATDVRVFALNNQGQEVEITYYFDWNESKTKGPFTLDFSDPETKTVLRKLDIIQNQSFSFMFRNNVIGEDLNISGYELTAQVIQTRDKNVK